MLLYISQGLKALRLAFSPAIIIEDLYLQRFFHRLSRKAKNYTKEQVAERAKISIRYLTAIENEGRKPSYDVLCRLIRCIGISADLIFYPDKKKTDTDDAQLVRLIRQCSARDRKLLFVLVNQMLVNGDAKS